MKAFQPSPAFQAFFEALMAQANAPTTSSTGNLTVPVLTDPHEQAFMETQCLPLLNALRTFAGTPISAPAPTPEPYGGYDQPSSFSAP
jgi:hypothetical protein